MLGITLNGQALICIGLISILYDYYLCWLVYERYGRQFSLGFFLYAPIAFSLPVLTLLTVPIYLLWESGLAWPQRLAILSALSVLYLRLTMKLTRKLLSKRFSAPKPTA